MKTSRLKNTPQLAVALLTLLSGMTSTLLAPAPALAVFGPEIELQIGETGTNYKPEDGLDGNGARFELNIVSTSTWPEPITFTVNTADQTATTADLDYKPLSNVQVILPANTLSTTFYVSMTADNAYEFNEGLFVQLTSTHLPAGARISIPSRYLVIGNDDRQPLPVSMQARIVEGDTGQRTITLTAAITLPTKVSFTYDFAIEPDLSADAVDRATAGEDFIGSSGEIEFSSSVTEHVISVQVIGDRISENNDRFRLHVCQPGRRGCSSEVSSIYTIVNDDVSQASIGDARVTEGNSGVTNAEFDVTLSTPSAAPITVTYQTQTSTADVSDFDGISGTLRFEPGAISTTVTVSITGETFAEDDESFSLALTSVESPYSATLGAKATGTGVIVDDDTRFVTIGNARVIEGNVGSTNALFTVSLSAASTSAITVSYATESGSANPVDYASQSGAIVFSPGQTSRVIAVPVNGDTDVEPDETFSVTLSGAAGALLGTAKSGIGTIVNDDQPAARLVSSVEEGGSVVAGGQLSYTLRVTNTGSGASEGAVVSITLSQPADATAALAAGWTRIGTSQVYTYALAALPAGETRVIRFGAQLPASLPAGTTTVTAIVAINGGGALPRSTAVDTRVIVPTGLNQSGRRLFMPMVVEPRVP